MIFHLPYNPILFECDDDIHVLRTMPSHSHTLFHSTFSQFMNINIPYSPWNPPERTFCVWLNRNIKIYGGIFNYNFIRFYHSLNFSFKNKDDVGVLGI